MVNITRILCPVDFSETSQHALEHAAALARWYSATLTVFHAYRLSMPVMAMAPGMVAIGPEVALSWTVNEPMLLADMRTMARTAGTDGIVVKYGVAEGGTVDTIVEQARNADLIVIGTHGRTGFDRLMLGSVTEGVLRKAPCPVLTIPPRADQPAAAQFTRILAATDLSDASARALSYACSLAVEADADLTVLHVIELPTTAGEWLYGRAPERLLDDVTAAARARLSQAIPAAVRQGCRVTERIETGNPYKAIVAAAVEGGAALIVVGSQGHGPLDQLLFGSTAQMVVRHAACPVLMVRTGGTS